MTANSLVFVDSQLDNLATLLCHTPPSAQVVVLDRTHDAVEQILTTLAQATSVGDLHWVCHGEVGKLHFGETVIDESALEHRAEDLTDIGRVLASSGAAIWLYGCHVAEGAKGRDFVRALSKATGATVRAATHPVGAGTLGASWDFDVLSTPCATTKSRACTNPVAQAWGGSGWGHVLMANVTPTLDSSKSPALTSVPSSTAAPVNGSLTGATLVASLIGSSGIANYADTNGDPAGIALTAGRYGYDLYYSTNSGATWAAVGAVSNISARVLFADANTYLYADPNSTTFNGTVNNAVTFTAWDRTGGYTNGQLGINAQAVGGLAFGTATAKDIAISGNYAYVSSYTAGVEIANISDPANPTLVGSFATAGQAFHTTVIGNHAYVSSYLAGVEIVNITNPAAPTLVATIPTGGMGKTAWETVVVGNLAYIANGVGGLEIFNISNPASPTLVGKSDFGSSYARSLVVSGNYAYLADGGLRVVDISNPASPTSVAKIVTDAGSVVVNGNYAYVTHGSSTTLKIFDISTPTSPVLVTTWSLPWPTAYGIGGLSIQGNYAYITDDGSSDVPDGVQVLDISNPASPVHVRSHDLNGLHNGLVALGNYAYVAASSEGLKIVDITGAFPFSAYQDTASLVISNVPPGIAGLPVTPQTVSPGVAAALENFTVGDTDNPSLTVTLTTTNGAIGSVTDANPGTLGIQVTGTHTAINTALAAATFTATAAGPASISVSVSDSVNTAVTGTYNLSALPAASTSATPVLDNSKSPTLAGMATNASAPTNGSTTGATLVSALIGSTGIANYSDANADPAGLAITGINTTNGTLWFSTNGGTTWTAAGAVSDTSARVLMADANTYVYYQPNTGYNGTTSDAITAKAWDTTGGYTNGQAGVNTTQWPVLTGGYNTSGLASGVVIQGSFAYVADDSVGLQIIDISNPAAPVFTGTVNTPGNAQDLAIYGTRAYIAAGGIGLQIIDITNPAAPTLLSTFNTSGTAKKVAVFGSYAYVADDAMGLQIVNVANSASPVLAGSYNTVGTANGVAISGNHAYVADGGGGGLQIINISNPGSPTLVGSLDTAGGALSVAVSGNYAYVADEANGLQIINISNPASPMAVGGYATAGTAWNVTIGGRFAYVSVGTSGLQVIDISTPASPTLVGTYNQVHPTDGLSIIAAAASDQYVYVANTAAGLQVLNIAAAPFSTASDTFSLTVAPNANDAPTIAGLPPTAQIVTAGVASALENFTVADADSASLTVTLTPTNGVLDNVTDADLGAPGIQLTGTPSSINTALAGAAFTAASSGTASLAVSVSDGANAAVTGTYNLSALPAASTSARPVLDTAKAPALPDMAPNASAPTNGSTAGATLVSALIGSTGIANYSDANSDPAGLAITGINTTNGTLWFSTNGGTTWAAVGAVSDSSARVLKADASTYLYYQPNSGYSGSMTDAIAFKAWDNTGGFANGQGGVNTQWPIPKGSYDTTGRAESVAISGTYAYVAGAHGGLQIIDISNLANPVQVGASAPGSTASDVAVSGSFAYVAASSTGLRIYNISTPSAPSVVSDLDTGGDADAIALSGNYAYVCDWIGGLRIIDISTPSAPVLTSTTAVLGRGWDIQVSGSYAYVGTTGGLQIFNISNPAAPVLVGTYDSGEATLGVAISGNHAYLASNTIGVEIVDISNPASPTLLGTYDTPGEALKVSVSGKHAFVADSVAGMQVLDISNPASPVLVGNFQNNASFYEGVTSLGVTASGGHVYFANSTVGLQVLELAGPSFSVASDTVSLTVANAAPTLTGLPVTPHTVSPGVQAALENFIVADDSGSLTVTLTATNGVLGNVTDADAGTPDIQLTGSVASVNTALAAATFTAANEGASSIGVSVSDGIAAAVTGTYHLSALPAAGTSARPVLDNSKTPVLTGINQDISAPTNGSTAGATLVASLIGSSGITNYSDANGDPAGIAVTAVNSLFTPYFSTDGGATWAAMGAVSTTQAQVLFADANTYIYLDPIATNNSGTFGSAILFSAWDRTGGYTNGQFGIDTSQWPALKSTLDTAGSATGVVVSGSHAYVADGTAGLQIINISNPSAPSFVGNYNTSGQANAVAVSGSFAYVADGSSGLQVVNLANPVLPVQEGVYNTADSATGVAVSGNYAYVADFAEGLQVINISNPANPTLAGAYNTTGNARGVAISGNYAYVADDASGLHILNISNPSVPSLVSTFNTAGNAYGVAVSGDHAFVADYLSGLQIIDISNPAAPTFVGTYNTTGSALSVSISGNRAYVADSVAGVTALDISTPATPTLLGTYDTSGTARGIFASGELAFVADGTSGLQVLDAAASPFSAANDMAGVVITAVNSAPTLASVPGTVQSVSSGVAAALDDFTVADVDSASLTVTLTATNGSLQNLSGWTVSGAGNNVYSKTDSASNLNTALAGATFTATAAGAASIGISVSDGVAAAVTSTYNLSAGNSAPTATGLPASVTVTEDVASNVDLSALALADANGDSLSLTLTADSGTLAATSGGGVTVSGSGTGGLTLAGTASAINTFLDTAANLKYTSTLNDNTARSISVSVTDSINTAVSVGSVTVNITPVNDAPTLSGVPGTVQSVSSGVAAALDDFTVADVDSASLTVTLTATNGSLQNLSGWTVSGAGNNVYSKTDSASNLNTALAGATFTATAAGAASIGISVSDGVAAAVTSTYNLSAGNSAPTATGLPASVTVTEDVASNVDLSALALADANGDSLSLTLTADSGTLAATSGGGVTVSGSGTGGLTLAGTASAINTFLDTAANLKYTSTLNDNTARSISVSVTDSINTAVSVGSVTVNITPVNDAPTLSGVPGTVQSVSSGVAAALDDFTVADVDSASLTVTLTATNGSLQNLSGWTVSGAGNNVYSKTDSASNLNTALAGATFTATAAGAASIGISVSDGVAAAVTSTYNLSAGNSAPTATGLPASVTVTEDVASNVDLSALALADANGDSLSLTLTADSGTLAATSGGGVTVSGSGTGGLTLAGTASAINTFLDTAANLKYTSTLNDNTARSISVSVTDSINTAVSVGSVTVNITPVNDAPTLSGVPGTVQSVSSGVAAALDDFTVADVDSASLTVTLTATNGSLQNLSGWTVSGAGNNVYSKTDSASNLNTALAGATFTATAAGAASIGISVSDGVAAAVTSTYNLSAGNSAPTATGLPASVTVTEDVASNVDLSALALADANGDSLSLTLTADSGTLAATSGGGVTVSGSGTGGLTLAGTASAINTFLDTAANLKYTSTLNDNTARSISVSVTDSINTAVSVGSVTVNITPVNDAPTLSGVPGTVQSVSSGVAAALDDFTVADVDSASLTVTLTATNGSLQNLSGWTVSGAGNNVYSKTDSASNLNTALAGATFTATAAGAASIGISVSDGVAAAVTSTYNLSAGNSAPTATGLPASVTVTEDVASNVDLSALALADANGDSLSLTLTADSGTLAATSGGGVTVSGSGTGGLTLAGTASAINTFLDTAANLKYTSTLNDNTARSISVSVTDSINTAVSVGSVTVNITPVNDAPTLSGVPGTVQSVSSGVAAALDDFTVADVDSASLTVTLTATNGSLQNLSGWTVSGAGNNVYSKTDSASNLNTALAGATFTATAAGAASIGISVSDGVAAAVTSTYNLSAGNSAPTATGLPASVTVTEDVASNVDLSALALADANGDSLSLTLTADSGTLAATSGGGVTVSGSGTGGLTLAGTASAINTFLDTAANLKYTSTLNDNTARSISVSVTDSINTAVSVGSVTVNITPVNDAPTLSGVPGTVQSVSSGVAAALDDFTVADVDSASLTVTLTATNGSLQNLSGWTVSGAGNNVYSKTDSASNLNTALAGATFTATAAGAASIGISVSDGVAAAVTSTYNLSAGNSAPTATGLPASVTVTEDVASNVDLSALALADANGDSLSLTLTADSGTLAATSGGGVTVSGSGTGGLTLAGTASAINTFLDTAANLKYTSTLNDNTARSISVSVTDSINTAVSVGSVTVNITPVNDAPTLSGVPGTVQSVSSGVAAALDDFTVADVDSASLTVTLTATNGSLQNLSGWTVSGAGNNVYSKTDSASNLNTALAGATFTATAAGAASIGISVSDGVAAAVTSTYNLSAGNSAPTATGLPASVTVTEDVASNVDLSALALADANGDSLSLTLTADSGTLAATSGGGVTVSGSGTGGLTLAGTASAINTFLDTAANLKYTSTLNDNTARSISVSVTDSINTAVSVGSVTVNITPVNDAPTLSGVPGTVQSVSSGVAAALDDFTVADVDSASLTVTLTATNGSLQNLSGWTVSGAGNNVYSKTDSASNLNTALAGATFTATAAGAASIGISVSDGVAAAVTSTYNLSAGNSAPTATGLPASVTVTEDVASNVDLSALALADANGDSLSLTLTADSGTLAATSGGGVTVSGSGTGGLTLAGTASAINTFLDTAANLKYTSTLNDNTARSISVSVTDSINTAVSVGSVTVNITPVNDAPTLSGVPGTVQSVSSGVAAALDDFTVADVDSASLTVTLTATNGSLQNLSGWTVSGAGNNVYSKTDSASNLNTALAGATFTATAAGAASIGISVSDGVAAAVTSTYNLSAGNSAPTATGLPASVTVTEDVASNVDLSALALADANGDSLSLTLTADSGTLAATSGGGVTVSGSGTGGLTLAGTASAINTFLDTAANLKYTSTLNDNTARSISVSVTDSINTAVSVGSVTVNITPVNDAPTLSGVPGTVQSVSSGVAAALDDFTVADVDSASLTVTLTATNGSLQNLSGWTVSGAGNNVYSKTDSASNLNTALAGATFTATAAGAASIGISVSDGVAAAVTSTYNLSAGNSAPTATGLPASVTVTEDVASNVDLSALALADANGDSLSLTLTADSGTLAATSGGGVTVSGSGTGGLTLAGTASAINTFLDTAANLKYTSTLNDNTARSISVSVTDSINTAVSVGSVTVNITPVNDAPTLSGVPGTVQSVSSGVAAALDDFTVADVDSASLTVTLTATNGSLQNLSGWTVSGAGNNVYSKTDSASNLNTALAGATFTATAAGAASIGISVSDGVAAAVTSTYNLSAGNSAPTATGLPASVTVTEDVASNVDLSALALADANGDSLSLTLTADSGTLAATSGGGVTVSGSGTGGLTLAGTASAINTFLDTAANLKYTSTLNDNTARSISVSVTDSINTAVSVGSVTVNITPVNDAPTLSGVPGTVQSVSSGVAAALDDFTVADVDSASLTVTLTATNGSLQNLSGWTVSGAGNNVYSKTDSASNLNTALAGATFTATAAGAASIGISVDDSTAVAVTGTYNLNASPAPAPGPEPAPSPASTPDTDRDGVPNDLENAVPALPNTGGTIVLGDGNGDGIKDSQQASVTSTTFLLSTTAETKPTGAPPTPVSLVADSLGGKTDPDAGNASITSIVQKDAPADMPTGMNAPLGLIGFTANIDTQGSSESFSLYVDAKLGVNGYWKKGTNGTWVNLASEAFGGKMVSEGGKLRLDFQIVDGGQFDADGVANGSIADPGAAGFMAQSITEYHPKVPTVDHFWF